MAACLDLQRVAPNAALYPAGLKTCPGFKTAPTLSAIGNLELLRSPTLALFCSRDCPAELVLQASEQVSALSQMLNQTPISGFHTPIEQSWLHQLLGKTPLIYCPARSLDQLRLSPLQVEAVQAERLLMLSPFPASAKRATANLAAKRNGLVAAIATSVFVAHATPGGQTNALIRQLLGTGKPMFTLCSQQNRMLLELGVKGLGE